MKIINPKFLSELIGTSFLVMVVVGSGIMASNLSNETSIILLANPAVPFARIFTDTFTGIFYLDAACFIIFQILGVLFAFKVYKSIEN